MDAQSSTEVVRRIISAKKATNKYGHWLIASIAILFGALLLFVSLISPQSVAILILLAIGIGCVVLLFRYTHYIILAMLVFAPFYDMLRLVFFPNIALLGAWQDLIVMGILAKAIQNAMRPGFQWRITWLDLVICSFIACYAFSVVLSPNLAVWFYGFRWYTLYAFFYLAMKTYRFTERELNRILIATAAGLATSAIIGYVLLQSWGENAYSLAWVALDVSGFWREGNFRWPATFPSPIPASICFALLLIIGFAHLIEGASWKANILTLAVGGYAIYLTFTRSGWLVGLAGLLAIVCLKGVLSRSYKTVLIVLLLGAVCLGVVVSLNPSVQAAIFQKNEWDEYRLQTFDTVVIDAFSSPFGVGVGTAGAMAATANQFGGATAAVDPVEGDSVLVAVLRDTGWLGFFSLIAIYIGFIIRAIQGYKAGTGKSTRVFSLVCLGFSIGLLTNLMNAVDVWPIKFYFWLFGALVVAIVEGRVDSSQENKAPIEQRNIGDICFVDGNQHTS